MYVTEIVVIKVLNMDMFLHKRIASLQKAFINPPESSGALFITDGQTFLCFKIADVFNVKVCCQNGAFEYST